MFQDGSFGTISSTSKTSRFASTGSLNQPTVSKLSVRRHREASTQLGEAAVLSPIQGMTRGYNTRAETRATFPLLFTSHRTDVDLPNTTKCTKTLPFRDVRLIDRGQYWFQAFPFWQFHVLFNSLFKVLFIFPSRYLFAIGLSPIFSFRWHLPPILGSIPKLPDSWKTYHIGAEHRIVNGILTLYDASFQRTSTRAAPENVSLNYNSCRKILQDFKFELFPLHSPLLGESLLVSFPPLIDMLKFSGFSCPISDQVFEGTSPWRDVLVAQAVKLEKRLCGKHTRGSTL